MNSYEKREDGYASVAYLIDAKRSTVEDILDYVSEMVEVASTGDGTVDAGDRTFRLAYLRGVEQGLRHILANTYR